MADSSFFQTWAGTVEAGDTLTIHRRGRSIACIAASHGLELVINDGSRSKFFAGASLSFDIEFEKIQIYNPNGTAVTFEIWTAMGRVDDNRLTASGNLNVLDPVTGDSFAEVIAKNAEILAMMQNANDQKSPATPIQDSVYALDTPAAGVYTAVLPASNTAGVLVRAAIINSGGPAISIFADTAAPSAWNDTTKKRIGGLRANGSQFLRDLYLPAGTGLYVAPSNTNVDASIVYEVL